MRFHPVGIMVLMAMIAGCTVGPDYQPPRAEAPASWTDWRSGDPALHNIPNAGVMNDSMWWKRYNDAQLNALVDRALTASPDMQSAALHFARAQLQYHIISAQQLPEVAMTASVSREQQSSNGASTRVLKAILPDPERVVDLMADPYNWYQAGVNFSWEIDLWGHVRRAIEAADADVSAQRAMLELAKLSIIGDVVNNYYYLRAVQQQIALLREDVRVMDERLTLIKARTVAGALDDTDQQRQQGELATTRAHLIDLQAEEAVAINKLLLLSGEHPGALQAELAYHPSALTATSLPSLSPGVPSEVALRRPDIRAAVARLHAATARIGVAEAELYPSITLGARLGYDSDNADNLTEWSSRSWSVGPSLHLPLFDRGRRKATVVLRETDQQQAAVDYHHTVLKAWQEIDDALNRYAASQQKLQQQQRRVQSTHQALNLIQARYDGGLTDFIDVLDSQRSDIQSRQALTLSQRDLMTAWAAVNRAVGNYPQTNL